jgi:hypothetical protein
MIKSTDISISGFLFMLFSCSDQQPIPKPDCSLVRNGKFELKDNLSGHLYHIERNDSVQREINEKTGFGVILKINWKDSCEYELIDLGFIINGKDSLAQDLNPVPMRVQITKITPNYLVCRSIMKGSATIDTMLIIK